MFFVLFCVFFFAEEKKKKKKLCPIHIAHVAVLNFAEIHLPDWTFQLE